ncbi:Uncharacterised protein [Vibrio cholerae]|nr:Uncharacterised protein [Vibrio cholerae]
MSTIADLKKPISDGLLRLLMSHFISVRANLDADNPFLLGVSPKFH